MTDIARAAVIADLIYMLSASAIVVALVVWSLCRAAAAGDKRRDHGDRS